MRTGSKALLVLLLVALLVGAAWLVLNPQSIPARLIAGGASALGILAILKGGARAPSAPGHDSLSPGAGRKIDRAKSDAVSAGVDAGLAELDRLHALHKGGGGGGLPGGGADGG